MNTRAAYAGLAGFFAFWAVMGPIVMPRHAEIMWPVFVLGGLLAIGLGVLALRGKFDDPRSPYLRALKIAAIAAIIAGVVFAAYSLLVVG